MSESLISDSEDYEYSIRQEISPQVDNITALIFESTLCGVMIQLFGVCTEMLVDLFASVLHIMIKYANALNVKNNNNCNNSFAGLVSISSILCISIFAYFNHT